MHASQGNLFTRDDTFFGVCEGLGQDLGINPNLLRVAFAVGVYLNPIAAFAGYFALGILVLATRLMVREPRPATATAQPEQPVLVENGPEEMAMAA